MGVFNFVLHHHPLIDPLCMLAFDIQQYNMPILKEVGEEVLKDGPFLDVIFWSSPHFDINVNHTHLFV
jgi:hypothetical protein